MTADHTPARDAVFALPLRVEPAEKSVVQICEADGNISGFMFERDQAAYLVELANKCTATQQYDPNETVGGPRNTPTPDAARVIEVMRRALEPFVRMLDEYEAQYGRPSSRIKIEIGVAIFDNARAALSAAPEGQIDAVSTFADDVVAKILAEGSNWFDAGPFRQCAKIVRAALLQSPRGKV